MKVVRRALIKWRDAIRFLARFTLNERISIREHNWIPIHREAAAESLTYAKHRWMRLPGATFIGFTGTPIEKADANTQEPFGGYVSIYDIEDAKEDKATVPIY